MITIESFVFNSFQVNTYLVRNEKGDCLVIDPAFYSPEEINTFDQYVTSKGLNIIGQLNTHCHVDHVLGVHHMVKTYNCPLRAHSNESKLLNNAPLMGEFFGFIVEPLSGIDNPIEDNDSISIGDNYLKAMLVPGHSPGSLCFYSREGGFVITGDTLFRGSIGRTDLPGGDYDTLIRSLQKRVLILPSETIVYPGHGNPTTVEEESLNNPFLAMA